jgi:hypothetical protein
LLGDGDETLAEREKRALLDARAKIQEAGGVLAMQDESVRDGVVRPGPPCWVAVTRVRYADSPMVDAYGLLPVFRFVVSDFDHRRELHSFAIDSEIALDAFHHSHPAFEEHHVPAPVYEIEPPTRSEPVGGEVIRRGEIRFLAMSMVTLENPPPTASRQPPGVAIRFAVSDETHQPLYSFTMNWPLALVALQVAWE